MALVLALTLVIKVAMGPAIAGAGKSEKEAPIAAFLQHQGFSVGAALPNTDPPMLPAVRADCRLRIAEISPSGWHRHVLAQLADPDERTLFVFRGDISQTQPIWQTIIDHNWHRLLASVGLHTPRRPVLGILASSGCPLRDLPWDEIAELQ